MSARIILQRILKFNKWHLIDIDERPYAISVVNIVNNRIEQGIISDGWIVEVGCGLGDIITSINWKKRIGCDLDRKVIHAAKILHPFGVHFKTGSFDILKKKKIEVLLALNFLHSIDESTCKKYLREVIKNNSVNRVVVDEVPSPPYDYDHDYRGIFQKLGYELEYESKGYIALDRSRRHLLWFKRIQ